MSRAVFQQQVYGRDMLANMEVAPPAVLPIAGAHGHVRRNRGYAAFLNSRGEVTAYNPRGQVEWQVTRMRLRQQRPSCCICIAAGPNVSMIAVELSTRVDVHADYLHNIDRFA